jgi:hypothetical protein
MKIDSLSNIGYAPAAVQRSSAAGSKASAQSAESVDTARENNLRGGLTSAERAYFASLFPSSSEQINAHNPAGLRGEAYSARGIHASVETGQIINRKV